MEAPIEDVCRTVATEDRELRSSVQ